MADLCKFRFHSISKIDEDVNELNFEAQGFIDQREDSLIWYFKNENSYKFIIYKDKLDVNVNNSKYTFINNKKTEAIISVDNYLYKASIYTNFIVINKDYIDINYTLDFSTFKGNYRISVELY